MNMVILIKKRNIAFFAVLCVLIAGVFALNVNEIMPASGDVGKTTRKIVVDAGHGGEDPGAVSEYSGIKEKNISADIAEKLKSLLENDNYEVIMTRSEDVLVYETGTKGIIQKRKQDLLRRKKIMDESGADIVISIHLNKFPETQYKGTQVFYPPQSTESLKLAESIQKSIKTNLDKNNKREALVREEPIIILNKLATPTVIVECGFLSNKEEEAKLAKDSYRQQIAGAIKKGVDDYYKANAKTKTVG
jgi:N-acetylmuramoyl-L-alanine amidase